MSPLQLNSFYLQWSSPFSIEFISFAIEFVAFTLEFVMFAKEFAIITLAGINQPLITRWIILAIRNAI